MSKAPTTLLCGVTTLAALGGIAYDYQPWKTTEPSLGALPAYALGLTALGSFIALLRRTTGDMH